MFPVGPGSSAASNFLLRLHPVAAKNLSIMAHGLYDRLIRPARALPIDVPPRPVPREELLVLPALTERRRVRPVLAARAVPVVRVVLHVPVPRLALEGRVAVQVARPVPVDLVELPVVLAVAPPVRA